jgi:hypothetical protein
MREQSSYSYDHEPEELSEWNLEAEDLDRTRILWGRVAALLLALVLAFFLGRTTGSVGASPERIDDLEAQLAQSQENVDELEAQLAEPEAPETPTESPSEQPRDREPTARARSYVVRPGDTLRDLAVRFYGDVDLARLIAEANAITDTSQLRIGEELEIPPREP